MSMQDTIADMLTVIRNGQARTKQSVKVACSKEKQNILNVLKAEGFIQDFDVVDLGNNKKELSIQLKYFNNAPVIREIKRVSKPSLRVYVGKDELPDVFGGLGIAVISTSKEGVITNKEARRLGIGGEVLCTVA